MVVCLTFCLWPLSSVAAQPPTTPATLDVRVIANASGEKAVAGKDGVVKIGWSRTDVPVTIDGMRFPPAAGLGSWAAFKPMTGGDAMVMGDTVVFQDEVDAAMDAAFAHGLGVTALHNHFFYADPPVYFMHIEGEGEPVALATGVKAVWDAIRAVRAKHPVPATEFPGVVVKPGQLDSAALSRALRQPAQNLPGVVKFTFGRNGTMDGIAIDGSMGLTTWAAFVGNDKLAVMDGDFLMTAAEVQPVLHALRKANIHIVALHTHMIGETPVMYFTHFWGKGTSLPLARGFKSALDAQAATGRH
ncbi:MAG: DUF1259 domain-containing protein [Gammaproteobacteria bacterium]|nr:DUF1259 domain-containing protein [Gammaproteobacteria bacterium]